MVFELRREDSEASLRISNTGPGLAADLQSRVFMRFFRGNVRGEDAIQGSGLGLSIAQALVEAHRGRIRFHSVPNELTTVAIHLPLAAG